MIKMKIELFYLLVLFYSYFPSYLEAGGDEFDPYKVLGVSRRYSSDEIRKTYKKLAREW